MKRPLEVTFDDQIFTGQAFGGVSRYFVELIDQYRHDPALGITARTPFRYVMTQQLIDDPTTSFRSPGGPAILRRGAPMRALNALTHLTPVRRARLLHHTYYRPSYLRLPAVHRVCTVYDMIPELRPNEGPPAGHMAKEAFVRASDAVFCISQTTKDDLLRFYGPLDKPVVVTHLAVSEDFHPAARTTDEPRYVAFVGRRRGYKNFDVVLRALSRLAQDGARVPLVASGGGPFIPEERDRIAELGLSDLVQQRTLPDDALPAFYADAYAMVFPSYYEGFGLPIVEGFAARCPVVVADTPCSLEISGGASAVFAPDDDEALAQILARLVADPAERDKWSDAGEVRARDFSWHRCAEKSAEVYRAVAGEL